MPSEIIQPGPISLRELKVAKAAIKTLVDAGWLTSLDAGTLIRGSAREVAYRIVKRL